jgi:hypothetical protein
VPVQGVVFFPGKFSAPGIETEVQQLGFTIDISQADRAVISGPGVVGRRRNADNASGKLMIGRELVQLLLKVLKPDHVLAA